MALPLAFCALRLLAKRTQITNFRRQKSRGSPVLQPTNLYRSKEARGHAGMCSAMFCHRRGRHCPVQQNRIFMEPQTGIHRPTLQELEDFAAQAQIVDLVPRLLVLFLQTLPEQLTVLEQLTAAGDGKALHYQIHKFQGSCAELGAQRLAWLCQKLPQTQEPTALLQDIHAEILEVQNQLRTMYPSLLA